MCNKKEQGTKHYFALIPETLMSSILSRLSPTEEALLWYLLEPEHAKNAGQMCYVLSAFTGQKTFLDCISPNYIEKRAQEIAQIRKQKYNKQHYNDAFISIINTLKEIDAVFVRTMDLME